MSRTPYASDLTDAQWLAIEPLLPSSHRGRPRILNLREVLNAILYVLRTGCAWRLLPHDFPAWPAVYYYFWVFKRGGVWQRIHDTLRDKVREQEGREVSPSAGVVDSQSVKTTEKGGLAAMMLGRRSMAVSATS